MPMPLSDTVMVRAWASTLTRIFGSGSLSKSAASVIASKRSLSPASDAFDTSSGRKISSWPYSECTIRCSSCFTSAWKPSVSFVAVSVMEVRSVRVQPDLSLGLGLCVRALRREGSEGGSVCGVGCQPDRSLGLGLCVRALRRERLEERGCAFVDRRWTAGAAASADAHRHINGRASLLVLHIDRRATFGEQSYD